MNVFTLMGCSALVALVPAAATGSPMGVGTRIERGVASSAKPALKRPFEGLRKANRAALREPSATGYVNATQIYEWSDGALYRLHTSPGLVSDIALQRGETLVAVAAGDTSRWVIGDTTSGTGASRRTHILVKPALPSLRTNLVITTDRRVYRVMLQSSASHGMAAIAWSYPAEDLIAVRRAEAAAHSAQPVAEDLRLEHLNFGYTIKGDSPAWRPIRAFDDGLRTFIEFPPSVRVGEIPPLFVLGPTGSAELVNYRQSGRYYVVDRLFAAAELRLGARKQQIVRILRSTSRFARKGIGR